MVKFIFSESTRAIPDDTILFVRYNYDHHTLFRVCIKQNNNVESIGYINISCVDPEITNTYQLIDGFGLIDKSISSLPSKVFSLGESIEFYENLQKFISKNGWNFHEVLKAMRDMAEDEVLLAKIKDTPAFNNVFLRKNTFEFINQVKSFSPGSLTMNTQININKDNVKVIVVTLDFISDSDKKYIRNNLVAIAKGANVPYPLKTVAQKLKSHLEKLNKNGDETTNKYGLTAEFFQAVIIRNQGFNQKYSYRNLEENSAKKGFDGLYTKDNEMWLLESKSSFSQNSHKYKHKNTIDKAYSGISEMISGKKRNDNDPWENAEAHLSRINSTDPLIKKLVQLSVNYTNKDYQSITDSNIILGSGVIHSDVSLIETDIKKVKNYLIKHQAKNELLVLLTFNTPDLFLDLLEEFANE